MCSHRSSLRTIPLAICSALGLGCGIAPGDDLYGTGRVAPDAGSSAVEDAATEQDQWLAVQSPTEGTSSKPSDTVEGRYDGSTQIQGDASCSDAPPPTPTIASNVCAPLTDNECDGAHDPPNKQGSILSNGGFGNGFDDDCDGLVDEGCSCDPEHAAGTTKVCYLMPSSWIDDTTKLPVGWCAQNSAGTVRCKHMGGAPEHPILQWDGECRGAQPPHAEDACMPGDFNCDGVDMNPVGQDCTCKTDPVTCPVDPLRTNPFPDPLDLTSKDPDNPLVDPSSRFLIDGNDWIDDTLEGSATDWEWEVTGGDCDNVLPFPTFALYRGPDATYYPMFGAKATNLGANGNQHGIRSPADSEQHRVYPAFSLSGDYVVRGKFRLQGEQRECTVKVQVRAPGIRAELCWDSVGDSGSNDVDLHFARLQGNTTCDTHGWFTTCGSAPYADDCYYSGSSGCTSSSYSYESGPGWGYEPSHDAACHGWGSLRDEFSSCTNPRLDRDNISCEPSEKDPNGYGFCGPENINIDNPDVGDRFLVGAQCYGCVGGSHPKTHPHINVYCNGERVLSAGYDPTQPEPHFPALTRNGGDDAGSMWTAALVEWSGATDSPCSVHTVPSKSPDTTRDGSVQYCVEDGPQNRNTGEWLFAPGGGYPSGPDQSCWH